MAFVHKDLTNDDYVAWAEFLRSSDSWTIDEIRSYELAEVQRVTSFAYENTAGYRRLFDANGVHPNDIRTLDDVSTLPFFTKELLRDNLEDFSADFPGRFYITTGGSSGIPTGMYRDPVSFAKELASKAHQYHRIGWREGDAQIVFRGLQINSPDNTEFVEEFNELRCSTYQFGTEKMELYRQKAFEFGPDWIRCYPSSGYVFARYLKDSGKPFPKIKGILCASEQLYDFQKALFHEVFGADVRVFSHYGHYELAALAGYCEFTDDYHVLPQYGFVELLDNNDRQVTIPGQVGEIVATSFITTATPFIRYRTRDLGVFKSFGCSQCGRPYQVWEKIEGRTQEFILATSGQLISPTMLNMHDDIYDHLNQFQFHQKEAGNVIFRFVPKLTCTDEILQLIASKVKSKLGNDINLTLEQVDEIALTKRGKYRVLIQELDVESMHPLLGKAKV